MPYLDILFLVLGAAFFSRGARLDRQSAFLWGGLSVLGWVVTFAMGGGLFRWLVGQLVVYGLLFAAGLWRESRRRERGGP